MLNLRDDEIQFFKPNLPCFLAHIGFFIKCCSYHLKFLSVCLLLFKTKLKLKKDISLLLNYNNIKREISKRNGS